MQSFYQRDRMSCMQLQPFMCGSLACQEVQLVHRITLLQSYCRAWAQQLTMVVVHVAQQLLSLLYFHIICPIVLILVKRIGDGCLLLH
jgi:hypothetical protein